MTTPNWIKVMLKLLIALVPIAISVFALCKSYQTDAKFNYNLCVNEIVEYPTVLREQTVSYLISIAVNKGRRTAKTVEAVAEESDSIAMLLRKMSTSLKKYDCNKSSISQINKAIKSILELKNKIIRGRKTSTDYSIDLMKDSLVELYSIDYHDSCCKGGL
jgi:hypothetical protein